MFELIGLYIVEALFGTRWSWIVAVVLVVGLLAVTISLFLPAQPDVGGTPAEIVARWNEQVRWLPASGDLRAIRAEFVQHVRGLDDALRSGDRGEERRARKRIAGDFRRLWKLGGRPVAEP